MGGVFFERGWVFDHVLSSERSKLYREIKVDNVVVARRVWPDMAISEVIQNI
jgi:hypothetical protein